MTAEAISTAQRNRLGPVYIRQSSPQQVARNLESQRRQRGFVNRAVELGWAANRIRVIDEDLGQSGARSGNRQGFQQTVTMAALGRIGIILALEDPARKKLLTPKGHSFMAYHVANVRPKHAIAPGPRVPLHGQDVYTTPPSRQQSCWARHSPAGPVATVRLLMTHASATVRFLVRQYGSLTACR